MLLAEIVTDAELPPDDPMAPRCGACRRCVEACPAGAIGPDGLVDSRRCVSYLTIEHRGPIPAGLREACGDRLFGCDACLAACPHNAGDTSGEPELATPRPLAAVTAAEVLEWTAADWDRLTRGSAGRRAKPAQWLRNAAIAAGNARLRATRPALERLAASDDPAVADAAGWALARLEEEVPAAGGGR